MRGCDLIGIRCVLSYASSSRARQANIETKVPQQVVGLGIDHGKMGEEGAERRCGYTGAEFDPILHVMGRRLPVCGRKRQQRVAENKACSHAQNVLVPHLSLDLNFKPQLVLKPRLRQMLLLGTPPEGVSKVAVHER